MFKIALIPLLFIPLSHGKLLKSEKEIINEGIKSTLIIETSSKGKLLETGAGFLVSKNGLLITNKHVLSTFLTDTQKLDLSIRTSSGKAFKQVEVLKCGDHRNIDLCLLKLSDSNFKHFFKLSSKKVGVGENVIKIGHCKNPPFAVDYAKLGKDYVKNLVAKKGGNQKWNKDVSMIETNVPQCSGDSGGPQFSASTGILVGVTTVTHTDTKSNEKFMMSIAGFEVEAFVSKYKNTSGRKYFLKNVRSSAMDAFPTSEEDRLKLMEEL